MDKAVLNTMPIGFDPAKSARNIADRSRGFGFERAELLDFETAEIFVDDRFDYGEERYCGLGPIGNRVHAVVFTIREPLLWVISLRKANDREIKRYADYLKTQLG